MNVILQKYLCDTRRVPSPFKKSGVYERIPISSISSPKLTGTNWDFGGINRQIFGQFLANAPSKVVRLKSLNIGELTRVTHLYGPFLRGYSITPSTTARLLGAHLVYSLNRSPNKSLLPKSTNSDVPHIFSGTSACAGLANLYGIRWDPTYYRGGYNPINGITRRGPSCRKYICFCENQTFEQTQFHLLGSLKLNQTW